MPRTLRSQQPATVAVPKVVVHDVNVLRPHRNPVTGQRFPNTPLHGAISQIRRRMTYRASRSARFPVVFTTSIHCRRTSMSSFSIRAALMDLVVLALALASSAAGVQLGG